MDGLLAETESLWRVGQRQVAKELGFELSEEHLNRTMGLRIDEVVQLWEESNPWGATPSCGEVVEQIVDSVLEQSRSAVPLPGVIAALDLAAKLQVRVALCSSSHLRLIESITETLGIRSRFEVVHSAENDPFGKPHPEPYLRCAKKLGVGPSECLVFEDSLNGALSAAAAGMAVIAVPDVHDKGSGRFGFATASLGSLTELTPALLNRIDQGLVAPSLSRPRFHLAFPVHDLGSARDFYGQVLGCREGRSSETWVDFDLFGHQIVAHLADDAGAETPTNPVDGEQVPARHFGVLLTLEAFEHLVTRLEESGAQFLIEPQVRFFGQPGEQHTCFRAGPV